MKRIKYNKFLIPGGLALFALLFACGKNFLNKPPIGVLSPQLLANQAGVQGFLIGAYPDITGEGTSTRVDPGDQRQITGSTAVFAR